MNDTANIRRIVRVMADGGPCWGVVIDGEIVALPDGPFGDAPRIGDRLGDVDSVRLLAPTVPTKIVGVGRNYVKHAAEHGVEVPTEPLLFLKTPSSVLPPGGTIVHISAVMTLEPGDVILTGTPSGVGPLAAGDSVEVEVGGVGVLNNSVE